MHPSFNFQNVPKSPDFITRFLSAKLEPSSTAKFIGR